MKPKTAFVFPGQGSQYVGMGFDLARVFPEAREVFQRADEALGRKISALCFDGPEEKLQETENTQPAILATSLAAASVLAGRGFAPDVAGGLSLGEYSALVTAGSFDLETAVPLVEKRGRFMQEAVPVGQGAMAAIIGLGEDQVREVCVEAGALGTVEPANYNCPGQIVITGRKEAVDRAMELARDRGARRAIPLPVSAPFHCDLLRPAADRLARELATVPVQDASIPVIANTHAGYVNTRQEIIEALTRQVASPVLWEQSIRRLVEDGIDVFLEVGPGRTLAGFIRKIHREAVVLNVQDVSSLEQALQYLENDGVRGSIASGR